MAKRKALSLRARFAVLVAAGFRCVYCGKKAPSVYLQVDHVIPVAAGGTNEPDNLVAACTDCNLGKSDRVLDIPRSRRGITYVECRPTRRQIADGFPRLHGFIEASPGASRLILQIPAGDGSYRDMPLSVRVDPFALTKRIAASDVARLFTVWYDA